MLPLEGNPIGTFPKCAYNLNETWNSERMIWNKQSNNGQQAQRYKRNHLWKSKKFLIV
jgi:hypothetical protein